MMNSIISLAMGASILFLVNSNNPMKMSFSILMSSSMMFLLIKSKTSVVWMPLIFFMLFTGGILMAFMILASILPNEKAFKMKTPKIFFIVLISTTLASSTNMSSMESMAPQMKAFLSSSMTLIFMMILILTYFFSSVNLNTDKDSSMRSILC